MNRFIFILFLFTFLAGITFGQSINEIKKEKEESEKEISFLNKLLEETKNNKSVSIEKLNILQQKIILSKQVLSSLNKEMSYLGNLISENEGRIDELQTNKYSMLDLYSKLIYGTWKKRNKSDKLMFIFSSSDFNQAYSRFKYFQQIQEYSKRQLKLIAQVNDSLELKNSELKKLIQQKNALSNDMNIKNSNLEVEQNNEKLYVNELQKKEKENRKKLEAEIRNRRKLENEISKLIARQTKKSGSSTSEYKLTPEEKLLSDDFVKNKGKLPWPVTEGFISEKFGVHAASKYVMMPNDGVNITTSKNSNVRTVFKGIVTEIFYVPGKNNAVIVRHGNYLTLYVNLLSIKVNVGDKVDTKEVIGTLGFDSEKGSVLNFQIWKDNTKQDPQFWLAK